MYENYEVESRMIEFGVKNEMEINYRLFPLNGSFVVVKIVKMEEVENTLPF